jgi:GDPmannose 4,6-dehydratase
VEYLRGDYSKAEKELGWKPKVKFDELVHLMVDADLDRWQRWQNGERFPWDAPSYPDEKRLITRR